MQAGLNLTWSQIPEDMFSHEVAYMVFHRTECFVKEPVLCRQSLCCSIASRTCMKLEEVSDKEPDIWPHGMAEQAHLKDHEQAVTTQH